jgi:hypothetical protein
MALFAWSLAALADPLCATSPGPDALEACLESEAPLEVRRAALASADLAQEAVRDSLLRVFVDGPLHDDLVRALVASGALPAQLAAGFPTRQAVADKLGQGPLGVQHCSARPQDGQLAVSCRAFLGCMGSCQERHAVAGWTGDGRVERSEEVHDQGRCGCCMSFE